MKAFLLFLVVLAMVFTTGCPKYKPSVDFNDTNGLVNKVNKRFTSWQNQYYTAIGKKDYDSAKQVRNELLEEALPYIDAAYEDYITGLQAGRDRANFVADVVDLGAAAAIGISNGERAIQILGVALTAFRGGRRSADLNFYKEQTTPILINKMDGNRATVRTTILLRENDGVDKYPIGAAIGDIVNYYNAGTLVRAFTELSKDTAAATKKAEDDKKQIELHGVPISKPSTEEETQNANAAVAVLGDLSTGLGGDANAKAAALKKLQNIYGALEKDDDVKPLLSVTDLHSTDTDGNKLLLGLVTLKRKLSNDSPLQGKINRAIVNNGK